MAIASTSTPATSLQSPAPGSIWLNLKKQTEYHILAVTEPTPPDESLEILSDGNIFTHTESAGSTERKLLMRYPTTYHHIPGHIDLRSWLWDIEAQCYVTEPMVCYCPVERYSKKLWARPLELFPSRFELVREAYLK